MPSPAPCDLAPTVHLVGRFMPIQDSAKRIRANRDGESRAPQEKESNGERRPVRRVASVAALRTAVAGAYTQRLSSLQHDKLSALGAVAKWTRRTLGASAELARELDGAPLRAELFSLSQLEQHARKLARVHQVGVDAERDLLLPRLTDNERVLSEAYELLTDAVTRGREITPAAEWLVDNYHLIEEQIRTARRHLPRGYRKELPRLVNGPRGAPRVYTLALELISHADGRVDLDAIRGFISAYQTTQPLLLGELWAIPIMLRLALIENMRRVVADVVEGRLDRERAGVWAERLLEVATGNPSGVVLVLAEMIADDPPLTNAFVAELARRLLGQGSVAILPTSWLEQRLLERGRSLEQVFQQASQSQAADQVSIGNSVSSLRFLGAADWREFVESLSVVDDALRTDSIYPTMDFATRDQYRHVVEAIARRSKSTELAVAEAAVELTRAATVPRARHVGYFLVAEGRRELERATRMRSSLRGLLGRFGRRWRVPLYMGAVGAIVAGLTAVFALLATPHLGTAALVGLCVGVAICASQLAVSVVNWLSTLLVSPQLLPRLDFSTGIPEAQRTIVAIPCMLTSLESLDELASALEVRFLANRDPHLGFALLTDFRDADSESLPGDAALLDHAHAAIEALAERYAGQPCGGFFLLHRARRWNAREGVWMGWERKRGKLEDFNAALRGELDRFALVVGPLPLLADIRFVLALDSDTDLPRDAARELAGTLAHPLNRPVFDAARGRVTAGYTILQPRVGISLTSASASRYAQLFSGECGIDPYTRAVSDVYQDVFDEGSFIGKGIYDVDSFQQALAGRFPDNRILSHDLLEGAYARSALVSDVIVYEDHPAAYAAAASRRARWIRGDWQIARWLVGRVARLEGSERNPLSLLSRWKIFDNLRRSLVPVAMLALLLASWLLPEIALFAGGVVASTLLVPELLQALASSARRRIEVTRARHLGVIAEGLRQQLTREAFALACLPYDAAVSIVAVLRANGRVLFTRRKLLEWRTAADAQRAAQTGLVGTYLTMWIAPVTGALLILVLHRSPALYFALPLLAAWMAAPALVWWMSGPKPAVASSLSGDDRQFLRGVARRTWRYFETYVTAEDNDLPPDNVQEENQVGVAHRTSPTNIGMGLLANLAAFDFGYTSVDALLARTTRTFATMDRLERYRGHFYNWYDTRSLEPLRPTYVSTVDSGNLAGHLLTLACGLEELAATPIVRQSILDGIADTMDSLVDAAREANVPIDTAALRPHLRPTPTTLTTWDAALAALESRSAALARDTNAIPESELAWWLRALEAQCRDAAADLASCAPWLAALRGARTSSIAEDARLDSVPTLEQLARFEQAAEGARSESREVFALAAHRANTRLDVIQKLAARCRAFADLDYDLLYDRKRRLLSIGYNVVDHRLDAGFYDLLASEARLVSYIAIAQGKLPQDHWFSLGRLLTTTEGRPALLSWSGSMFEYLMPQLVMPVYEGTLLEATSRAVVARHVQFGRTHGVPWGVSESGYFKTDAQLNYQYRAFGVPGLGFKRGLADDLVIAPYASALALMVDADTACANLRRLADESRLGAYGFYEAIDYTPARLPPGKSSVTVRSYMAHHQGMAFLSMAYALLDRPMQRRFEADPALRATTLLLQERVPRTPVVHPHRGEVAVVREPRAESEHDVRVIPKPSASAPEVHLLSNGRYHVAVTNAGGGYSRWRDLAVTRWYEDPTRDCWGTFVYVRDVATGAFWSAAHQPTLQPTSSYEAIFSQGRAEFRRRDGQLDIHVEISVSPEDDIELRQVSIANHGSETRRIELTSYAEVVLTQPAADASHRTFSNLFVQTEILRAQRAILCTRRPRSGGERPPWMIHLMTVHGAAVSETSYETDRAAFIGRARSPLDPAAMHQERLADGEGSVLDPIVAIRTVVEIAPAATVRLHFVTGVAETRAGAVALIERYTDAHMAERVLELAWTQSQVVQRQLDATAAETVLFERLASSILYASPALRASKSTIAHNRLGQSALWAYGISGDLPIALVRIADSTNIELVRQMVLAHTYWRLKGLSVDLVIWNEDPSGYRQDLQDRIMAVIAAAADASTIDRPAGIFVRRGDQISDDDSVLMQTIARVIVSDGLGSLEQQLDRRPRGEAKPTAFVPRRRLDRATPDSLSHVTADRPDLMGWNGMGGFTRDGREYVITTSRHTRTPLPWVNVIANPYFGTVVSESGGAYTWCENAHGYRLTPWGNDPVGDSGGEAMYLRDEDDGRFWSPTPLPCAGSSPYTTRHGFGYTVFETVESGIASELRTFVAMDAPVKFLTVKLRNTSGRGRRISLTGCFDLVLGAHRPGNLLHLVTNVDVKTGALFGRNPYANEFAPRVAFLDCSETQRTVSGDRLEVLGRNGHPSRPACMSNAQLSGRLGAGLDACLAMQSTLELADGEEREIAFMFGSGRDLDDARRIVERFRGVGRAQLALESVWEYWKRTLGAVNVHTPDTTLDVLANGWLMYQVIACRMWGRSGFYQSGGAFGFRDQLQDASALIFAEPALLREQLIRAAAHQFPEGDVQHWWHPPLGRGVRTRISDDYLWLPYSVCRYVTAVGDTGVLDELIEFIDGRPLKTDEESYYDLPLRAGESATLYEHCVRAIENGLKFGQHGLPLMGSGDWNDGMNLVGEHGKGESVWLAFFLHDVLKQFAGLARRKGDATFADRCIASATTLAENIARQGWDGDWYRRAYFDDGEPLGSSSNVECQIDSLPQSWAVLTGVGSAERASAGLDALDARLVDRALKVIKLFDPPFDQSILEPGYVKGYVPGVRENGGQYTHAAVWATMAFAAAGRVEKAWELFDLINPVRHGNDAASIATYMVEPYVVAADVYTNPQHAGRGGWTWYTGSAGWMYRLIVESLLGLRLEVDRLFVEPRMPESWTGYAVHYRHHDTVHHLEIKRVGAGQSVKRVICDGVERPDRSVALHADRKEHWATIEIGGE